MRKSKNKSHFLDGDDADEHLSDDNQESASLLTFPLRLAVSEADESGSKPKPTAFDVAEYIAEMLYSLEQLALQSRLDVLGLMIAMAREQANDDVRDNAKN